MTLAAPPALDWDRELAEFLAELSALQEELLGVLHRKRELMARVDLAGLEQLQPQEEDLVSRLQQTQRRREELLARAAEQGLPHDSLASAASAQPAARRSMARPLSEAAARARQLRMETLTHWVLAQQALLHVSQLLEIIATGGQMQPTYGRGAAARGGGSLVNEEA